MISEGNTVHPEAQVSAAHSELFDYDRPKTPNQHSDKTHTYGHCQRHYPEARLARWKLSTNASREYVNCEYVENSEAEDYRYVNKNVSIPAVLTNDGRIDPVNLCDTLEQGLYTFSATPVPLG